MTYVVTLEGFTPPERTDQVWTQALIYESATSSGAGTLIETINLSPLDTDPKSPMERNLTTTHATLTQGWYSVTFRDNVGNISIPSTWLQNNATSLVNWRPTVEEVAARVRNRTIDANGNERGTFTSNTIPTNNQVEDLIDDAVAELIPLFGESVTDTTAGPDPDAGRKGVRGAAAAMAAAEVELTYYGKEVARQNSPYDKIVQDYQRRLANAAQMLGVQLPGGATGSSGGGTSTNSHVWVPLGSHYANWGNDNPYPYDNPMTRPF